MPVWPRVTVVFPQRSRQPALAGSHRPRQSAWRTLSGILLWFGSRLRAGRLWKQHLPAVRLSWQQCRGELSPWPTASSQSTAVGHWLEQRSEQEGAGRAAGGSAGPRKAVNREPRPTSSSRLGQTVCSTPTCIVSSATSPMSSTLRCSSIVARFPVFRAHHDHHAALGTATSENEPAKTVYGLNHGKNGTIMKLAFLPSWGRSNRFRYGFLTTSPPLP